MIEGVEGGHELCEDIAIVAGTEDEHGVLSADGITSYFFPLPAEAPAAGSH